MNGAFKGTYSLNIWVKVKRFGDIVQCYDFGR